MHWWYQGVTSPKPQVGCPTPGQLTLSLPRIPSPLGMRRSVIAVGWRRHLPTVATTATQPLLTASSHPRVVAVTPLYVRQWVETRERDLAEGVLEDGLPRE